MREIPFGLIQYPLYEHLKKHSHKRSDFAFALCGAKAGGIAAIITCPFDVVKTRIMTNNNKLDNIISTTKDIYKSEGILTFFKGIHVRFTLISVGGMIFFGTNEIMKTFLGFDKVLT